VVAYKSLLKSDKGNHIAIVGGNHLAYLTVQFAKSVFGLHVTVFAAEGSEGLA
jgi:D-arabinose 1-dehydrogenase-like Zn-dependent alcohol dehydrogenase